MPLGTTDSPGLCPLTLTHPQDIAQLSAISNPQVGTTSMPLGTSSTEMVSIQMAPDASKAHTSDAAKGARGVLQVHGGEVVEVPDDWPRKGDIRFRKLCLRYYPGAPLALK